MRNPNGYGSVVRLSGNRRNPFCARKTVGFDDRGYPVYAVIGYYPTREAGLIALAEYNKNPYDLDAAKITLEELYTKWLASECPRLSKSLSANLRSAWKHAKAIGGMRYKDIRARHMQSIIDGCGLSASTQAHLRNFFVHIAKFAIEMDVSDKDYTRLLRCEQIPETSRVPMTPEEVHAIEAAAQGGDECAELTMVLLYSGWRISELLNMRVSDVDMDAQTMTGGTKTAAGKNRVVPIHPAIRPIIARRVVSDQTFLFERKPNTPYSVSTFHKNLWSPMNERLHMTHTPHETRHTFRSALDRCGANKRCSDMLMGHKSPDVGERVYTHKTIEDLRAAIELVTY